MSSPASPWSGAAVRALLAVLLLWAGYVLPTRMIPRGTEPDGRRSPVETVVAREAWAGAWVVMLDNPLQKLWYRAARVAEVERAPGHCRGDAPADVGPERRTWRARVRLHGWFGVPLRSIYVRCGGGSFDYVPFRDAAR